MQFYPRVHMMQKKKTSKGIKRIYIQLQSSIFDINFQNHFGILMKWHNSACPLLCPKYLPEIPTVLNEIRKLSGNVQNLCIKLEHFLEILISSVKFNME